jgi:hypothetical protein
VEHHSVVTGAGRFCLPDICLVSGTVPVAFETVILCLATGLSRSFKTYALSEESYVSSFCDMTTLQSGTMLESQFTVVSLSYRQQQKP